MIAALIGLGVGASCPLFVVVGRRRRRRRRRDARSPPPRSSPSAPSIAGVAYLIIHNWDTIVAATKAAWDAVVGAVQFVWNWIKDNWPLLLAILTGPIGVAVALIVTHWDTIKAPHDGLQLDQGQLAAAAGDHHRADRRGGAGRRRTGTRSRPARRPCGTGSTAPGRRSRRSSRDRSRRRRHHLGLWQTSRVRRPAPTTGSRASSTPSPTPSRTSSAASAAPSATSSTPSRTRSTP